MSRVLAIPSALGFAVACALAAGVACTGGGPASPAMISPGDVPTVSVSRGLRRLSRREYDNVVHDLLGDITHPASGFGLEVYVNGFDNGSDGLTVHDSDVDAFQAAAEALAAKAVASDLTPLIGSCNPAGSETTCVDAFLATFPGRAYRRPPTDGELTRLRAVYAAGASGGFRGGLQLMLEAVLQSPAFLYREELGAFDPSLPRGLVRLTDDEVASELSFLVTGSMPDAPLFSAVRSGRFKTEDDLRREAARLLAGPAARSLFRAFLHQWLATDQLAVLGKDTTIYPTFTPLLAASMVGELDRYFDEVLWTERGSFHELLTSAKGFVDPALAPLYGVAAPRSDFVQVTLDGATRAGVLTRAGFLAVHADADSSGPVPRGVFVLNALLCEPPSPPPADVPPAPQPSSTNPQTTRQRFTQHLSQPLCAGCHAIIDGVGFGFEKFDGIGAFRSTENGFPVDDSGNLSGSDVDGPFVGASSLAEKLARSENALRCFVKQVYRFAMGQEENARARSLLEHLAGRFTEDTPVTELFLALIADPAFVIRRAGEGGAR